MEKSDFEADCRKRMTAEIQQKKGDVNKLIIKLTVDSWLDIFLKNKNLKIFYLNSLIQYNVPEKIIVFLLSKILKAISEKDEEKRKVILPNDSPGFTSSYSTEYETQLRVFYNNVRKTLTKEKNSEYLITLIKN